MRKTACFTGHREFSEKPKQISERLYDILEKLIKEQNITDFYAGGAKGFDTISALCVIKLRCKYPTVKLHLLLPCSNEEQTKSFNPTEKYDFQRALKLADTITYTSEHYFKGCMKVRNEALVKNATDYCICYYDSTRKGGTARTVKLSEEKGLKVINLFMEK